jgi:pSer/pThr/pTyr-binding forkhead associated (FHA) protein
VTACGFCGRENQDGARFCIDCGQSLTPSIAKIMSTIAVQAAAASLEAKRASTPGSPSSVPSPAAPGSPVIPQGRPVSPDAAARTGVPMRSAPGNISPRMITCKACGSAIDPSLPFCAHCGTRTGAPVTANTPESGAIVRPSAGTGTTKLALLDQAGQVKQTFPISSGEAVVGRSDGDIQFGDDVYLSPVHAQFGLREGQLWVRDLGSRNGTWVFIDGPHRMLDGDVMLVGSQLLRFRRLGYPGPHPPEADRTRRLGSLTPTADIAVLAQLRADGSVRDTFHLSPGRNMLIGREHGDWLFPYDQTMSATHAEVRSEDSDFVVADAGSRNGVAIAVRGERALKVDQRVLLGDRILRVEQL